jgi:hypothetical protein
VKKSTKRQADLRSIPLSCGISGCDQGAVCGLQSKSVPKIKINVCRTHFEEMMGRPFDESELTKEGR